MPANKKYDRKKVRKVRVLVNIEDSPLGKYMVMLSGASLINEVRKLIGEQKHSKAIVKLLSRGEIEWRGGQEAMPAVKVDLMISRTSAHWDLK